MKERLLQVADVYEALLSKTLKLPIVPCIRFQMIVNPRDPTPDISDIGIDDFKEISFEISTITENNGEAVEECIDIRLDNIPIGHA